MGYEDVPSPRQVTPQVLGGAHRMVAYGLDARLAQSLIAESAGDDDVDAFVAPFLREGARWEERARAAADDGRLVTAQDWYRQAFYLYRVADFAYTENVDGKRRAHDGLLRAFEGATAGTRDAPSVVRIELDGHEFDALLAVPPGGDAVPGCVFVYGSDGIKEEHFWASALPLVRRGIAVLVPDGPGQGTAVRRHGIPARADSEVFVSRCVDVLQEDPRILSHAIGIMGSSAGGYLAPRAFSQEPRLCALQVNSALHTPLEGSWENYRAALPQLRYNVQAPSYEAARTIYEDFTLTGLHNVDPSRPARIWHGTEDERIPVEQVAKLAAFLGDEAEATVWDGADHNLINVRVDAYPQMWDWLAARLREAAARSPRSSGVAA